MRQIPDKIYEPRALWEVMQLEAGDQPDPFEPPGRVTLTPTNWINNRRSTMVLTHMLLAPINYLLQRNDDAAAKNGANFNDAGSALSRWRVFLSAPGRYHWSIEDLPVTAFAPCAAGTPSMEFSGTPGASSLFGVSRWDFDFEGLFWLPRQARIQFDLSPWGCLGAPVAEDSVKYSVLFNELPAAGFADRLPGTARLRQRDLLQAAATYVVYPAGPAPFPPDGFGAVNLAGTLNPWEHAFPPNEWDKQEPTRGVTHSVYSGFAVAIDQIAYDDSYDTAFPGIPKTELANRVATRARTTNGGSQEWWWRPGCPLSLVAPTVGSALVHKFEHAIVLAQGDALTVELQAPPRDPDVTQDYQLGVSMLGYAVLEG